MASIDLTTPQNVTITYELASLGDRILAQLIDVVIVLGGYYFLLFLFIIGFDAGSDGMLMAMLVFILPLACFLGYHFLFELLRHGQSWGKQMMGLQVVRLDGEDPQPADFLLRSLFYFTDLLASGGILGALLISATPNHQRLGDMTAGTGVIKTKVPIRFGLSDILRISSLENYEPSYAAVKQFNEADMLLIKNALVRYERYPNDANRLLIKDLAARLAHQLEVGKTHTDAVTFLQTLIKDYIVLTR